MASGNAHFYRYLSIMYPIKHIHIKENPFAHQAEKRQNTHGAYSVPNAC